MHHLWTKLKQMFPQLASNANQRLTFRALIGRQHPYTHMHAHVCVSSHWAGRIATRDWLSLCVFPFKTHALGEFHPREPSMRAGMCAHVCVCVWPRHPKQPLNSPHLAANEMNFEWPDSAGAACTPHHGRCEERATPAPAPPSAPSNHHMTVCAAYLQRLVRLLLARNCRLLLQASQGVHSSGGESLCRHMVVVMVVAVTMLHMSALT